MLSPITINGPTKAQCRRIARQRRGMKLLRVWVPDTKSAAFAAQAAEQAARLRGRPEETEA
jgi:hypothetical protein